ncbi:hypothetical protein PMPD1_0715 [Paramixta manurensis]|uniref:Lysozyme inhibitor LprI-like N-terminal domain-containing protein n=1 Tax=Paramixta manurensis TaxID=2740817 RepID=A0A6M8UB85_9GAMM|nr:hypothetical protein PMPD1_0715 [Erwiniaceae bacterium PD-1]
MCNLIKYVFTLGVSLLPFFAYSDESGISNSQWQVSHVNVNTESERTLNYQYDDNKLVGRLIEFSSKSITSTLPEKSDCQQPTYQRQKTTLNQLISSSMSGDDSANAKNYDLGVDGNHQINSFKILCQSGSFGRDMTEANAWVAMPEAGKIFINWYDGTILTLTRLTAESNVSPSFDCHKAASQTEKTICQSNDLASWDVSVAKAYKSKLTDYKKINPTDKDGLVKISHEQKAWLTIRNKCGTDTTCLKKTLMQRVDELEK